MRFTAKEDIEAPIEYVFSQITDFAALERSALRRGAEIQRVANRPEAAPGMAWETAFMLRGKRREMTVELTVFDAPNGITLVSQSPNISGHVVVDLVALSRERTRLNMLIEIESKTLAARLLLQSLKLARSNLNARLGNRLKEFGREVERRRMA